MAQGRHHSHKNIHNPINPSANTKVPPNDEANLWKLTSCPKTWPRNAKQSNSLPQGSASFLWTYGYLLPQFYQSSQPRNRTGNSTMKQQYHHTWRTKSSASASKPRVHSNLGSAWTESQQLKINTKFSKWLINQQHNQNKSVHQHK